LKAERPGRESNSTPLSCRSNALATSPPDPNRGRSPHHKRNLDRFSRVCKAHDCVQPDTRTVRDTDRDTQRSRNVGNNSPHLGTGAYSTEMWPEITGTVPDDEERSGRCNQFADDDADDQGNHGQGLRTATSPAADLHLVSTQRVRDFTQTTSTPMTTV